jgi:hypothetical protein
VIRKVDHGRGPIPKTSLKDEPLSFSFKFYCKDADVCPGEYENEYTQKLIERLKALSGWTITEFLTKYDKAVRNHAIDWTETARPNGFDHLPAQLRDGPAWQFSVSANEHGRVHGLLLGATFYIVWLDYNHRLYP